MNNIDRLIIKNKRYKYYRVPTIEDISVGFKMSTLNTEGFVNVHVGNVTYSSILFEGAHSNTTYRNLCTLSESFNNTKSMDELTQICDLLSFNVGLLFTKGYRKGLFTKEGVRFIQKVYNKINKIICDITKSINKIQDLELDVATIHPQVSSIYAVSNTHLSGLQRESMYLKNLLRVNGENV